MQPAIFSRVKGFLLASLLIFPHAVISTELFQVDFELGETHSEKTIPPEAVRIRLIPNDKIREWSAKGGFGWVGDVEPDLFSYEERKDNVLEGVRGITRTHPLGSFIQSGGLQGLQASTSSLRVVSLDTNSMVFGRCAMRVPFAGIGSAVLFRPLPRMKARLHVRLVIRCEESFFRDAAMPVPIIQLKYDRYALPPVYLVPASRKVFITFDKGKTFGKQESLKTISPSLLADSLYALALALTMTDTVSAKLSMQVNGHTHPETPVVPWNNNQRPSWSLRIGKLSADRARGSIWFDEIWIGEDPAPLLVKTPKLSLKENVLQSTPYADFAGGTHDASHWQITGTGTWSLPEYNSGRQAENLLRLPFPFSTRIEGELNQRTTILIPQTLWTGLKPGHPYVARVRYQGKNGGWSDWGRPYSLTSPIVPSPDTIRINPAGIEQIRFTPKGKGKPAKKAVPGEWFELAITSPVPWSTGYRYADVYLHAQPQNSIVNYRNRGGGFSEESNYGFSFSFPDTQVYVKTLSTPPYFGQATDDPVLQRRNFTVSEDRKTIRTTVRLLDSASTGLWAIRAYAFHEEGRVTPFYNDWFIVENPKAVHTSLSKSVFATIVGAIIAIILLLLAAIRLPFGAKSGPTRKAEDTPIGASVSLEFDSPYDENIKKARDFILANFQKGGFSAKDVATHINVTPVWLSTFFRQGTGKTVAQFINEVKIGHATNLLTDTKTTIAEIAYASGFNSPRHFDKTFRKIVGKSPKEYREASKHASV